MAKKNRGEHERPQPETLAESDKEGVEDAERERGFYRLLCSLCPVASHTRRRNEELMRTFHEGSANCHTSRHVFSQGYATMRCDHDKQTDKQTWGLLEL